MSSFVSKINYQKILSTFFFFFFFNLPMKLNTKDNSLVKVFVVRLYQRGLEFPLINHDSTKVWIYEALGSIAQPSEELVLSHFPHKQIFLCFLTVFSMFSLLSNLIMTLLSLIYSDTPPPFLTAPICHYVPASCLKNCKIYQLLLNRTVKEKFQFCHASENLPNHYNSLVAANTTGHSFSRRAHSWDWRKEGGLGLAVHAEKVNNGVKSWTLESLLSALSPQVCCVSGEILVTPVQRHWDIWPEQGVSTSKFFYPSTPRLTSSIWLWLFWHSILPSSFWHCFSHNPLYISSVLDLPSF